MKAFSTLIGTIVFAALSATVQAQTFMLDDCVVLPDQGILGPVGCGAEYPTVTAVTNSMPRAPSPSLTTFSWMDGTLLGAGSSPTINASPGPEYMASLSDGSNTRPLDPTWEYSLYFSVDRVSIGVPGSSVASQAALNQQPGDIFRSATGYRSPQSSYPAFTGTGFVVLLPSTVNLVPTNVLSMDESSLGLPVGGGFAVTGDGATAPVISAGTHNNVDGFDFNTSIATSGTINTPTYQTPYPPYSGSFLPLPTGSSANIYDMKLSGATFCGGSLFAAGSEFATTGMMGLAPGDIIDALIMFDVAPTGSIACSGPGNGANLSGLDRVVFSLAPGSPSLTANGLSAADVLLSDFTSSFGLYASASSLGLIVGDNIDALEYRCVGDLDGSGVVNFLDFVIMRDVFFTAAPFADINGDGIVNFLDFARLSANFLCQGR